MSTTRRRRRAVMVLMRQTWREIKKAYDVERSLGMDEDSPIRCSDGTVIRTFKQFSKWLDSVEGEGCHLRY